MSIETYYLMTRDDPSPARLAELSVVEVLRDVTTDEGGHVPAGSRGTIVATWGEGEAYEVEFARPVVGLATITASSLRTAWRLQPAQWMGRSSSGFRRPRSPATF